MRSNKIIKPYLIKDCNPEDLSQVPRLLAFDENYQQLGYARFSECEVHMIFVNSAYRKRGVGTAMLNEIVNEFQQKGCAEIKLQATSSNIGFYQKNKVALSGNTPNQENIEIKIKLKQ